MTISKPQTLREKFIESYNKAEGKYDNAPYDVYSIADWWLQEIKTRVEKLKKKSVEHPVMTESGLEVVEYNAGYSAALRDLLTNLE